MSELINKTDETLSIPLLFGKKAILIKSNEINTLTYRFINEYKVRKIPFLPFYSYYREYIGQDYSYEIYKK